MRRAPQTKLVATVIGLFVALLALPPEAFSQTPTPSPAAEEARAQQEREWQETLEAVDKANEEARQEWERNFPIHQPERNAFDQKMEDFADDNQPPGTTIHTVMRADENGLPTSGTVEFRQDGFVTHVAEFDAEGNTTGVVQTQDGRAVQNFEAHKPPDIHTTSGFEFATGADGLPHISEAFYDGPDGISGTIKFNQDGNAYIGEFFGPGGQRIGGFYDPRLEPRDAPPRAMALPAPARVLTQTCPACTAEGNAYNAIAEQLNALRLEMTSVVNENAATRPGVRRAALEQQFDAMSARYAALAAALEAALARLKICLAACVQPTTTAAVTPSAAALAAANPTPVGVAPGGTNVPATTGANASNAKAKNDGAQAKGFSVATTPGTIFEDKQPVLNGTGKPGTSVVVNISHPQNGTSSLEVPVGADGTWTLDLSTQSNLHHVVPGRYTVEVRDPMGGENPVRTGFDFRTPNAQQTLTFNNNQDRYETQTTSAPAFSGTAPAGTTVRVDIKTRNSSMSQETTVNADGTWTVDFGNMGNLGTLEPGLYTATATVVGGNVLPRGHGFEIKPAATTTATNVSPPPTSGFSIGTTPGTIFEDKQPVLTGTGKPGTSVVVNITHPAYGTSSIEVPVAADGSWTLDLANESNIHQVVPGRYSVEVRDPMGGENPVRTAFDFRTPNATPALTFNNDQNRYEVQPTSAPSFSGTAPAGTTVQVEIKTRSSSMRQEATVNADGTWKVDFGIMGNLGTLEPGLYTATATVVGSSVSVPARGHGFEIKAPQPVSSAGSGNASTSTAPAADPKTAVNVPADALVAIVRRDSLDEAAATSDRELRIALGAALGHPVTAGDAGLTAAQQEFDVTFGPPPMTVIPNGLTLPSEFGPVEVHQGSDAPMLKLPNGATIPLSNGSMQNVFIQSPSRTANEPTGPPITEALAIAHKDGNVSLGAPNGTWTISGDPDLPIIYTGFNGLQWTIGGNPPPGAVLTGLPFTPPPDQGFLSGARFQGAQPGNANQAWSVDGVNITDMAALGASPTYYDFGAIEEIQVTTGGNDALQMTGGVGINIVTKRGSNEFHGSARGFFTNDALQNENVTGTIGDLPPQVNQILEFGGEVGGPIIKDRLWFWGSANRNKIDETAVAATPDSTALIDYGGKLSGQITDANEANAFYHFGDKPARRAERSAACESRAQRSAGRDGSGAHPIEARRLALRFQDSADGERRDGAVRVRPADRRHRPVQAAAVRQRNHDQPEFHLVRRRHDDDP